MSLPDVYSLRAEAVTVEIGGRALLQSVSCEVKAGEILVILGPNGAGKSTLMRTLAGDLLPTRGNIWINRQHITACPAGQLALTRAVLPQSSALAFPFSVEEVVMMGRAPHLRGIETTHDRHIVLESMRRTDVSSLAARNYLTLSGGEKQRVHLARVLAQLEGMASPRYLLLDEPVSSLDMAHQHACMKIARDIAGKGAGVIAVLHDLNLAAMYATRVLLLHRGKVAGSGSPADLFTAERIAEVFDQSVVVMKHPTLDCPMIAAV